jgi:hypothetical protein
LADGRRICSGGYPDGRIVSRKVSRNGKQALSHGLDQRVAYKTFASESDFAFGWMNIDIDVFGIEFEEEAADRESSLHQRGVIAFDEGVIEPAMLDRAAIHEQVLILTSGAGNSRRADQTPDPHGARVGFGFRLFARSEPLEAIGMINGNEPDIATEHGAEALAHGFDGPLVRRNRRQLPGQPVFLAKNEADLR